MAQWSRDPGSSPGSVAAGRETHAVEHNLPSVAKVKGGFGRQGCPWPITCGLSCHCVKKQCGLAGLCFGGCKALDLRLSRVRTGVTTMGHDCYWIPRNWGEKGVKQKSWGLPQASSFLLRGIFSAIRYDWRTKQKAKCISTHRNHIIWAMHIDSHRRWRSIMPSPSVWRNLTATTTHTPRYGEAWQTADCQTTVFFISHRSYSV